MATAAQRNWEERQRRMSEEQRRLARQQAFADNVRLAQQELAMRAYESSIVSTASFQSVPYTGNIAYQPLTTAWFTDTNGNYHELKPLAEEPLVEDDYNI